MSLFPISLKETCQLQKLGVKQNCIGFSSLTIESDKFICVCDRTSENHEVLIVEPASPGSPSRYPIKSDSARMNPRSKLIALKAGKNIQVFDADAKKRVKMYVLPEEVVYWRWVTSDVIVLITEKSVYHWRIDDESETPVKMFDRLDFGPSAQIINYKCDSELTWMALVAISNQNNKIVGQIQLYSSEQKVSQSIEGHACCFINFKSDDNAHPSKLFSFSLRSATAAAVYVNEIGTVPAGNKPFAARKMELFFPADSVGDFPVSMHSSSKTGIIFIITKLGFIHLYEIETRSCIFVNRISQEVIFATADLIADEGFIFVNRTGSVSVVTVNKDQIVPFLISKQLEPAAFSIAARSGYPGAESAFLAKFNDFFNRGMFVEAAKVAAKTSGNAIRNAQTIARFQAQTPSAPGQAQPIFNYFSALLESGKLNALESVELCKFVFAQNKKQLVEKWLREDKLECTQELGDLAKPYDINLALSIYLRGNCQQKVVQCFAETGQFDKILVYSQKVGFKPDYTQIIRSIVRASPDAGLQFAKSLLAQNQNAQKTESPGGHEEIDIEGIANSFIEVDSSQHCISFLAEALKNDNPDHARLQTKLFELSLMFNPQIAEALFQKKILTHFDKNHVARLCEQAGLIQRALEHYTDIYDIKRTIVQTHLMNPEWLVAYFGSLSVDDCLICLKTLLEYNLRQNLQIVVQVAVKYHEQLGVSVLINIFESCKSIEGLFMFLSSVVYSSQDPEVHFKYIQSAVKTNQLKEVERICRESNFYEPEKVKNFLKESKITDQIPLIIVCDRFDFVNDLVLHLHKNNLLKYIEIYVQKVNPARLPEIVGALLDLDCREDFLRGMMMGTPPSYSMEKLVEEVSKRNRIKLVRPIIENLVSSGNVDPSVHSALAIIFIESNNRPDIFLKENQFYDSLYVGRYLENRDPNLACLAYEKGGNSEQLIEVCVKNGLFKNLSRYAILRKDPDLWATLLNSENEYRRSLIDQTSQSILSETYEPECISEMVKALMSANLPKDLIDLLEKIVLADSPYRHHKNLQNLLLLTAIKTDATRIIDYVNRLDNYDAVDIANVAVNYRLYEEALSIYKKFEIHASAMQILTDHIRNLDRAFEYAERVNLPPAWSILGKAQLACDHPKEAIDSFLKASDPSSFSEVIASASSHIIHEQMLKYLTMVRKTVKDSAVDSEYAYCLAYTDRFEQLQDFLNQPQCCNATTVGDRLFNDEKYEAAKSFYKSANCFPKLALTHVKLNEFQQAIEMARKASNTKMWKTVCEACLAANEFRFAQMCALNLVVHPEELPELVSTYEELGKFTELISLLEASIHLERAHMGIFTELAILYAKYSTAKLRDHLELYWSRINIPKVIKAANQFHLWSEVVFLHDKYEEYDQAVLCMINHPSVAFNEPQFRDLIQKVNNQDIHYKAISFYYEYKPLMLNDLMIALSHRVDNSKAINILKSLNVLPICKSYLIHVQKLNISIVNEALNEIYVQEEAYDDLRTSIEQFTNYDAAKLATELENHPSVEFRRISTLIRKLSNKWSQTMEMAKKDGFYGDAILYASESRDPEQAQNLLEYFISINRPDQVVSLLYYCYDILKPDQVLETCWINNMTNLAMPFLIQFMKEYSSKVDSLEQKPKSDDGESSQPMFINTSPSGQLMIGSSSMAGSYRPQFSAEGSMYSQRPMGHQMPPYGSMSPNQFH